MKHQQGIQSCHNHIRGLSRQRLHYATGVQKEFYATPALSTRRVQKEFYATPALSTRLGFIRGSTRPRPHLRDWGFAGLCTTRSQATLLTHASVSSISTFTHYILTSTTQLNIYGDFRSFFTFAHYSLNLAILPINITIFIVSETSAPVHWPNLNKYCQKNTEVCW